MIKVSLTVELKGGVMFNDSECKETIRKQSFRKTKSGKTFKNVTEEVIEKNMNTNHLKVLGNTSKREILTFKTRKTKPVYQQMDISKEAYDSMTGATPPMGIKIGKWLSMSTKERLEEHLDRIMRDLRGTSYTYVVFEDE